jgi:hypothetical protein
VFLQARHIISVTPSVIALRTVGSCEFTGHCVEHVQRESISL